MDLPNIKKPCKDCPFRIDCPKKWLGEKRIKEILAGDSFVCHKTTGKKIELKQCAGFMLLKGDESVFVTMAKRLTMKLKLSGRALVFKTKKDCINHHK